MSVLLGSGLFLELALDDTTTLDGDALEADLAVNHRTAANGQIAAIECTRKITFDVHRVTSDITVEDAGDAYLYRMQRQGATHGTVDSQVAIRTNFANELKAFTDDRGLQVVHGRLGASVSVSVNVLFHDGRDGFGFGLDHGLIGLGYRIVVRHSVAIPFVISFFIKHVSPLTSVGAGRRRRTTFAVDLLKRTLQIATLLDFDLGVLN